MEFITDINDLKANRNVTIDLIGAKLPAPNDVFFRAKQDELFRQYETARLFLRQTETEDWSKWFQGADPEYQEVFELLFMEKFYEAALLFYNIVVDYSWSMCYVSAEYCVYKNNKGNTLESMVSIDEAYALLRNAEENVKGPTDANNPFTYLKKMCPEFEDAIDLIIGFCKKFKDGEIRWLYNFVKHRGRPLYKEIQKYDNTKLMSLNIQGQECPTDIRDVQKSIGLKDSIQQLKDFDDNELFPYIKQLILLLEKAVNPSKFVF